MRVRLPSGLHILDGITHGGGVSFLLPYFKKMEGIILCEESQEVTKEFRSRGHQFYSCDILPCSGGHPEWHIQADAIEVAWSNPHRWDFIGFHPPCTKISNSSVRWLYEDSKHETKEQRWLALKQAVKFFRMLKGHPCPKIYAENPVPHRYAKLPPYQQIIHPWQHGHKQMKPTCIWLKGLPHLVPTDIIGPPPKDPEERKKWQAIHRCPPGPMRSIIRSKTYPGIAAAMAAQWG